MIEYLSPQYHLINYMFCCVAKLSSRAAEDLWRSVGLDVCYENIRQKLITPDQAFVVWESWISDNVPHILKRDVAAYEISENVSISLRWQSLGCTDEMSDESAQAYHLMYYILSRIVGLTTTASKTLMQSAGVNLCPEAVNNHLITAKQARDIWVGHVSDHVPRILTRKVASERKPKRDKLHRLSALKTYHAPTSFEKDMCEVLLPSDWEQLQRVLAQKRNNCKPNGLPCYLDIFHIVLMLTAYRLHTGDDRELDLSPREIPICRFQDKLKKYSIFDSAFDTRTNNTRYNLSRFHRDGCLKKLNEGQLNFEATKKELKKLVNLQKTICEIDDVMRDRIELQLTLQDAYFCTHKRSESRPEHILHFENEMLIIIEDNPHSGQLSVFENLEFVLHKLLKNKLIKSQRLYCKTRTGIFHEIMYDRSEKFAMRMPQPVSNKQAAFLDKIVSNSA